MNSNELESSLKAKGWTQDEAGNWSKVKRSNLLGSVEAGRSEQAPIPALDSCARKRSGRKRSVGDSIARVTMVMLRKRLLDPDAVAFSMKPLTDAVAASLGVDDADPCVAWEWKQVVTDGQEGVLVKIEN